MPLRQLSFVTGEGFPGGSARFLGFAEQTGDIRLSFVSGGEFPGGRAVLLGLVEQTGDIKFEIPEALKQRFACHQVITLLPDDALSDACEALGEIRDWRLGRPEEPMRLPERTTIPAPVLRIVAPPPLELPEE